MPTKRTDPTALRAAAEAQLERLDGPLWAASERDEDADWIDAPGPGDGSSGSTVTALGGTSPVRAAKAPRRKTTAPSRGKRRPGRPASEVPRLPTREVRLPVVVDERMREVAAWAGIEPIQALWLLSTLGWESWQKSLGPGAGAAP